jgi:hypothetical protein
MADIGIVAKKRHETLERVLAALEMDLRIPSTKVDRILTEAFYLEILERLAARVVALEALAKRSEGLADLLAAVAEREEGSEKSIEALVEAVAALLNREGRKAEGDE